MDNKSSNPFDSGSKLVLSVPKVITVKLVDSSELTNLKLWSFMASLFCNVAVGVWVWYGQNTEEKLKSPLFYFSLIATGITVLFIGVAIYFDFKIRGETQEIIYRPNE